MCADIQEEYNLSYIVSDIKEQQIVLDVALAIETHFALQLMILECCRQRHTYRKQLKSITDLFFAP